MAATPEQDSNMPLPKILIFDVNETLLDLEDMRTSVGGALGGRADLLPLWFSTMLHYSLVDTVTGDYHDFGQIGTAALLMVAEKEGIALEPAAAKAAITGSITKLPPHPDVKAGLTKLAADGYRIASLTNSSNAGVAAQFAHAGLTEFFEKRLSIEDIRLFKPDLRTYAWALKQLGVQPHEAMMVAAHAWDLAGAKAAGLQTAFIQRPGATLYPNVAIPDLIVTDLDDLARQLAQRAGK